MSTKVVKARNRASYDPAFRPRDEYSVPLKVGDCVRVVTDQAARNGRHLEGKISYVDAHYQLYRIEGVEGSFARGDLELVTAAKMS